MKAVEYVNEPRRIGSGACCFMGVDKTGFSAFWIWQDALDRSDTCLASCHDRQVAFDLFGCDSILSVEL